jgi:hypothetical protein
VNVPAGQTCLVPGNELAAFPGTVTLEDYVDAEKAGYDETGGAGSGIWEARQLPVQQFMVDLPTTGYVYLNIHMDYGLKDKTADINGDGIPDRYSKDSNDNALASGTYNITVPNNATHGFSFTAVDGGTSSDSDSVHNLNSFKRNPGVGGLVTSGADVPTADPVEGAAITLKLNGTPVGSAVTDVDGYYQIVYKHKGKATQYTVTATWGSESQTVPVMLKANGFELQGFFFETPP